MTQQTFTRRMYLPPYPTGITSGPTPGTSIIDAANEIHAAIIRAPKAGDIRGVWYRAAVATGATIVVGAYEVVVATGVPADTPVALATNSFIAQVVTTGDNNDFIYSGNFTADATVTKGQLFSICWIQPAVSAGAMTMPVFGGGHSFPYAALFTGTWAKNASAPMLMLEYSDGSVEIPTGCWAQGDAAATAVPQNYTISTSTTPDVAGIRFRLPFPARINGGWAFLDADSAYDVKLVEDDWDGASSGLLASSTAAGDANVRSANGQLIAEWEFDTAVDVVANTYYRMLVVPTTGSSMILCGFPCVDADHFGAQPLGGANWHATTAKDPNDDSDWTNYDNGSDGYRCIWIGLSIDGLSDGVSSGTSGKFFGG